MRILTVIQHFYPALAGAEKFGQALAEAFRAEGHQSIVVTGRWERSWKRCETINGLTVYRHSVWWVGSKQRRQFAGISYMVVLFLFLLRHRSEYDVMLVHQAQKGAFVSVLAGRLLRKPVVVIVHCAGRFGDLQVMRSSEFGFYTRFMINTIKKSDAFVAICSDIKVELTSEGFDRVQMIHDGIVPWKTNRNRHYGSASRLVTLARLHPQKGIDVLIRALALLQTNLPWTLDICGEGPERESLEALSSELGLDQRITFLGLVRNVEEVLDRSDLFVLPSRGEGMGVALLEAMYAALPCIVTRVSGFVDIIDHETNGILVDPEDPASLAAAIERMMGDEELRRRLGTAGRSTVIERFTLASTARQYIDLLESIITRARSDRTVRDAR